MDLSRRGLLKGLCAVPVLSLPRGIASAVASTSPSPTLPDKASFPVQGLYLDAAYAHPMSSIARSAYSEYIDRRIMNDHRIGPGNNARNAAVELFAKLINANSTDIAVVPSTMEGENLVGASLRLDRSTGVVTDALHYDASLVMYEELAKRGVPVKVVAPRAGGIDLADMEKAVNKSTRLIAVSLVSNVTGFQHDLKTLCGMAHAKGALVYADIIQAAGAVPIDVKASGVDVCACGTYKWLMGDFGTAFLYVRPDRLPALKRVQIGWRQIKEQAPDTFPLESARERENDWKLGSDTASVFEVSTPAWGALACVAQSLTYIQALGVDRIAEYRKPLIDRLRQELPQYGFKALTPPGTNSPVLAFSYKGASRFATPLRDARIQISVYENRIRISPSVYNDMDDVERLLRVLSA